MLKFIVFVLSLAAAVVATAQPSPCVSRLFISGYYSTVHVFDACTGAYLRDLDSNARIKGPQAATGSRGRTGSGPRAGWRW